jgi:hypothetical protein
MAPRHSALMIAARARRTRRAAQDVEKAVSRLHVEGHVHQAVMENLDMCGRHKYYKPCSEYEHA